MDTCIYIPGTGAFPGFAAFPPGPTPGRPV